MPPKRNTLGNKRGKGSLKASAFPGWTGPPNGTGSGRTHILNGMALVAVDPRVGIQEGIIDMGAEVGRTPLFRA